MLGIIYQPPKSLRHGYPWHRFPEVLGAHVGVRSHQFASRDFALSPTGPLHPLQKGDRVVVGRTPSRRRCCEEV